MQKPQFLLQLLLLACHCLGLRHWGQISSARSFQLKSFQTVYYLLVFFFSYYDVWDVMSFSCLVLVSFFMEYFLRQIGRISVLFLGSLLGILMWSSLQCNYEPVFNVIMKHKVNFFSCVSFIYISFFQICYNELIFMNLNQIRFFLIVHKIFIMSKANKYKHQKVQLQTELQGSPTSTLTYHSLRVNLRSQLGRLYHYQCSQTTYCKFLLGLDDSIFRLVCT